MLRSDHTRSADDDILLLADRLGRMRALSEDESVLLERAIRRLAGVEVKAMLDHAMQVVDCSTGNPAQVARWAVMLVAHRHMGVSCARIGQALSCASQTAMRGVRRAATLEATDPAFRQLCTRLMREHVVAKG